ncbi:MAG: prepilin-type N-terminal cleavage/methylation domain-containing protein [Acidobacteriia bacterium]|nr:prepilin-type N-terminal cleavage/methylation domain-containing protein [Terriglobia bacterium]
MRRQPSGFTMVEILIVILIMGIITAFALPSAINFVKGYRLHADASAIASQLNVTRFRATSQYTPYRLHVSASNNFFSMDRMNTSSPSYGSPFTEITLGLSQGDSFLTACPVSTKPGTLPSSFTAASTDIYFNTRGLPVDIDGLPINTNAIYLKNDNNLYDAITVSLGGRITVWGYAPTTSTWVAR